MNTLFMEDEVHFVREKRYNFSIFLSRGDTKSLAGFRFFKKEYELFYGRTVSQCIDKCNDLPDLVLLFFCQFPVFLD